MNELQYKALCEACDSVLLAEDSTLETVAISWLHVLREHPVWLARYSNLFESEKKLKIMLFRWINYVRNKTAFIWQIGTALCASGRPWAASKCLPDDVDFLFISHALNESQSQQENDFYFGNLPNQLVGQGYSVVIALINHSNCTGLTLSKNWEASLVPRIVLSKTLQLSEEVSFYRRLKKESLRLRKCSNNVVDGLLKRVIGQASQEALLNVSRNSLRINKQISKLVSQIKPKTLVLTHEGHAWERMAFSAARHANHKTRCVGYQHAAIFRLQHSIRRKLANQYNPDHILTAGVIGKNRLEALSGLEGIPITVFGSNRSLIKRDAENVAYPEPYNSNARLTCLVIPEGLESECHLMFEFSLACAEICPEILFIWRLHPVISYEGLVTNNYKLKNLPVNVVLSKGRFDEDIAQSHWVLYRGSTAVIQAVSAGLNPVYLIKPDELNIDPIYDVKDWRIEVSTALDFQKALNTSKNVNHNLYKTNTIAIKYCEDFFTHLDIAALTNLVSNH